MLTSKNCLITFIILLFICEGSFAQYEVSVTTIPVWVKVLDESGKPILSLKEQDFEVFEDGQLMVLSCFEEVNLDQTLTPSTQTESVPSAPAEPERFVILLDLYNTTPREYAMVQPALQSFLGRLSNMNVQVMLAALMPDRRLGIVSRFTKDLSRIKVMLDKAQANAGRDVASRSRTKQMRDAMSAGETNFLNATGAGEEGKHEATQEDMGTDAYQTARLLASQEVESCRFTLSALDTFAQTLSNMELENHTSIILVSGGFSANPGRKYFELADAFSNRRGDVNAPQNPQLRKTGFSFQNEVQEAIGKMNKLNVTLYTLDTRGAVVDKEYQDSLIQIAHETGGIPFFNSDNFNQGLEKVQEDIQHQYLVCYRPPEHKSPGKYHTIRVSVKRSGAVLRYRNGYIE